MHVCFARDDLRSHTLVRTRFAQRTKQRHNAPNVFFTCSTTDQSGSVHRHSASMSYLTQAALIFGCPAFTALGSTSRAAYITDTMTANPQRSRYAGVCSDVAGKQRVPGKHSAAAAASAASAARCQLCFSAKPISSCNLSIQEVCLMQRAKLTAHRLLSTVIKGLGVIHFTVLHLLCCIYRETPDNQGCFAIIMHIHVLTQ